MDRPITKTRTCPECYGVEMWNGQCYVHQCLSGRRIERDPPGLHSDGARIIPSMAEAKQPPVLLYKGEPIPAGSTIAFISGEPHIQLKEPQVTPLKFRKIPEIFEAIQFDGTAEGAGTIVQWSSGRVQMGFIDLTGFVLRVEGESGYSVRDSWVVRSQGAKGPRYFTISNDAFRKQFESAEATELMDIKDKQIQDYRQYLANALNALRPFVDAYSRTRVGVNPSSALRDYEEASKVYRQLIGK